MTLNQTFVDNIVKRARESMSGLGEPKASYSLEHYEPKDWNAVALCLVNAHVDKYDLSSLMAAAMEQAYEFGEEMAAAKRNIGL